MMRHKILGCLYGAAYGDSLGALTESCLREEIKHAFPEGCYEYADSISRITKGIIPGQVTDDFGASIYLMKAIQRHNGDFNRRINEEALLDWSKDEVVFAKYAGQNSKSAIEKLKLGIAIDELSKSNHFARQNTNGGAMKVSPAALLAVSSIDEAIQYALTCCWPTHYNSAAASGACAIACAVWCAQQISVTISDIVKAAIYGARKARQQLEKEGFAAAGPYVDYKIKEAAEIVRGITDPNELLDCLNAVIGTKAAVQESIPAVFAILIACSGDFKSCLNCAVNAGGDTDTIASMVCAITGGMHGIDVIDVNVIEKINTANQFLNLAETINDYTDLIMKRG